MHLRLQLNPEHADGASFNQWKENELIIIIFLKFKTKNPISITHPTLVWGVMSVSVPKLGLIPIFLPVYT